MQGIWMGMIFGTFLQTLILLVIVWRTNWSEEVNHPIKISILNDEKNAEFKLKKIRNQMIKFV